MSSLVVVTGTPDRPTCLPLFDMRKTQKIKSGTFKVFHSRAATYSVKLHYISRNSLYSSFVCCSVTLLCKAQRYATMLFYLTRKTALLSRGLSKCFFWWLSGSVGRIPLVLTHAYVMRQGYAWSVHLLTYLCHYVQKRVGSQATHVSKCNNYMLLL